MKTDRWQRTCRFLTLGLIGMLALLGACGLAGARFNLTGSLPKGLYWTINAPVTRDAYVMFCPPSTGAFAEGEARGYISTGYCPSGYTALLKKVSGIQGDRVLVTDGNVLINGTALPLSAAMFVDNAGRPLPRPADRYVLNDSQIWVMSDTNPRSFDSRYFGPIERQWVTAVVRPVVTWGYGGTLSRL